jgi:hypothetical protein
MESTMQRRHFRLIADTIANLSLSDNELDDCGLAQVEALRKSIAEQFADALRSTNGNFDRSRFVDACLKA